MIFFDFWDKLYHMNTKQRTEEKVFSFMEEHHMLNAHDRVVAGVSGGADSVCLLFVLLEYQRQVPFCLAVVHVNHGIRKEAGKDARYVEELCKTYDIPFYPFEIDVRQRAKQAKCSEEEAGRNARYEAFAQAAEEFRANKIAVAHNCNDRSETLLFNLFRGSGIKGLGSIRPVRDNIIRPILCLERREIEAYLREQNISYCQDATNEEDDYTRNRIRHHILPYAEQEIASGSIAHMAQTADLMAETEDYLEQQTEVAMRECVKRQDAGKLEIQIDTFLKNHSVICKRILHRAIVTLAASARDISYVHVRDLLTLFTESGNREICLPYGILGRRLYDKVFLEYRSHGEKKKDMAPISIQEFDEETGVREILLRDGRTLEIRLLSGDCIVGEIPSKPYTKWFDYDRIEQSLLFRTRRTGDYLTIAGKGGQMVHKSVKDYMIAEKIPQEERDSIPMLAEGNHVIWLVGYRISEYYKINRNTKRVLQVQLIGRSCEGSETEEKDG